MAEPKDKFSISMDPELVQRLDAVAEARGEARSTVIERIVRTTIAEEEKFLQEMENPVYRTIARLLTESPRLTHTLAKMVGEQLSDEQFEALRHQAQLGEKRQKTKRGSKGKAGGAA